MRSHAKRPIFSACSMKHRAERPRSSTSRLRASMARVLTQSEAKQLGLAGRKSLEIVSGEKGSQAVTLRLVEIPVPVPGEVPRGPHLHKGFEECIYVLAGEGCTESDSGRHRLKSGD